MQSQKSLLSIIKGVLVFCLIGIMPGGGIEAQEKKSAKDLLIAETMRSVHEDHKVSMVWWIPTEFWRLSLSNNKSVTPEQIENIIRTLRPYFLVAIVDGRFGSFAGVTYRTEAELRQVVRVIDKEGNTHAPIPMEKVEINANNLLSMMKPVLANTLGPMGTNMHFFVFPAVSKNNQPYAEPKSETEFTIKVDAAMHKWKLPLASLLPPKVCPIDQELMKGDWKFCPYHGEKLVTKDSK